MARKKTINLTEEDLQQTLKRYIYGEAVSDIAKEYACSNSYLSKALEERFGNILAYRHESIVVYLQYPKRTVAEAAKRFKLTECGIYSLLRDYFRKPKGMKYTKGFYHDITIDELKKLHAPYEQDVIAYLERTMEGRKPSLFEGLSKEERIAKARDINMRVKANIAQARLRKRREEELRHEHHWKKRIV